MFKNAMQKKLRQRFFVTPKEGVHFSGVLIECDRDEDGFSVFTDVKVHVESQQPASAQGETYIRNSHIAYCQLVPNVDS